MITEYFKDIFVYNGNSPMIFTRLYFWVFLAIVLAVYSIVYKKKGLRNSYLFLVSLFFYYKTSGLFFLILLFSTVTDFFIGQAIYKSKQDVRKKWFVALSVFLNLFVLSFFKYAYFFAETFNYFFATEFVPRNYFAEIANGLFGTSFQSEVILLPVGISFFTFQTMSYAIDIYRGKVKPVKNILDFGFYVSFFPQLVAGPIVRASEFIPQLYREYKLTQQEFGMALFLILKGMIKKMIISDYIAVNFVDRVFENPLTYTGFENMMAVYGYSLQVYADFSGYTDIAIGVALLMGFHLPVNFNSPYKALHVGEFWKRWHISLSSWLKDYLYIPMGGNRQGSAFSYIMLSISLLFIVLLSGTPWLALIFIGIIGGVWLLARYFPNIKRTVNTNINLMLTMLIGGLWHGASWMFVIWGGLNGIGLVVYKFWRKISPFKGKDSIPVRIYSIFLTFTFITFTRIWFRSPSIETANNIMYKIAHDWTFALIPEILVSYKMVFIVMLIGLVVHWLSSDFKEKYQNWFIKSPIYVKVLIAVVAVFLIYQAHSAELQPFIYFQF